MMYEIFEKLMNEKGVRFADVAKGSGVSYSTFTDWKAGRQTPKTEKLSKIADYFGVTIDYLVTGKRDILLDDPEFRFVADAWKILSDGDKAEILALIGVKVERYRAKEKADSVS